MSQAVDTIGASTAQGGEGTAQGGEGVAGVRVLDNATRASSSRHFAGWSGVENRVIIIAVEAAGTFRQGDGEGQRLMLVPSDT